LRHLTEHERRQIIEKLAAGASPSAIAREYNISRQYASMLKSRLNRRELRKDRPAEYDLQMTKESLRRKAYPAVSAGLDCPDDPYKRGNLGVQVLKGVGDFQPDNTPNINVLIQNMPPEFRARYLISNDDDDPALVIEASASSIVSNDQ
jgi:hypothetical protein